MSGIKLAIMVAACRIRIGAGEELEGILASWPSLTETDREQIRAAIIGE